MDKNKILGNKHKLEESSDKSNIINEETTNDVENFERNSNIEQINSEGLILKNHNHWINKLIILKNQLKHNLMSSSADGQIIIYDSYPNYNPLLKMQLFGESGVTYLTELKNGSIIACSFGASKQIILNYDKSKNKYSYEIINYFYICTTYISKCIELNNENLLFISQQNIIILLEKIKDNNSNKEKEKINDFFVLRPPIHLLIFELCINILQLKDD